MTFLITSSVPAFVLFFGVFTSLSILSFSPLPLLYNLSLPPPLSLSAYHAPLVFFSIFLFSLSFPLSPPLPYLSFSLSALYDNFENEFSALFCSVVWQVWEPPVEERTEELQVAPSISASRSSPLLYLISLQRIFYEIKYFVKFLLSKKLDF